ncbi:MAG TPA: DUF4129 domain-containing protein [Ktedonobacteraceae bacterium]|nr:DUF4129 domain-containing protein [Ktedonobacteraceae bacterium]
MDSPPEEPQVKKNRQGLMSGAQWLKEHVLAAPDSAITSLGEFLLPALLGAMESCWIAAVLIGLAGTGFLGLHVPLIPIWGLFLYLVGSQALLYYLELRTTGKAAPGKEESETTVDARLFFVLTGVMCLLLVWLQIYSSTAFLLNPRWVGSLISDILFLNIHFYQILGIIVFSFFLCWRGLQLASRRIEPSSVFRVLCIGLGVIIAVILLRAELESAGAVFHDDIFLLLLIPVFLLLALAAHALARIAFVRRTHPIGLQGSVIAQERAVIGVIGSIGIVLLLLSLVVGLFASPAFLRDVLHALTPIFAGIGVAYNWLVGVLAAIITILGTPIYWLLSLFTHLFPPKASSSQSNTTRNQPHPKLPSNSTTPLFLIAIIKIVLPVLIVSLVVYLAWRSMKRRRKVRARVRPHSGDIHESLFSWSLFWTQLKALLAALLGRFFRRKEENIAGQVAVEPIVGSPAMRTIREIYRAFLKKAASRGYARRKYETPEEFRQRLDEKVPVVEPQLASITEAYTITRYSGDNLDEDEVEKVKGVWGELERKWV